MRQSWWKVLCTLLLAFTVTGGFLMPAPRLDILNETIRNLYFHVPMWFTMMALFTGGVIYSVKYLRSGNLVHDIYAAEFTKTGIAFSIYGMITGMEWAKFTWGEAWSNDPKQLGTALCMLSYFAYLILRNGVKDEEKRAKISGVYNVFAFALIIPLIGILPRMVDSLHPGGSGNPAFKQYDRDTNMNLVFYSACIGWILLGFWIASLKVRTRLIEYKSDNSFPPGNKKTLPNA
jgi:heme exporter protein C